MEMGEGGYGQRQRVHNNLKVWKNKEQREKILRKWSFPPGQFYDQKRQMLPNLPRSTLALVLPGGDTRYRCQGWKQERRRKAKGTCSPTPGSETQGPVLEASLQQQPVLRDWFALLQPGAHQPALSKISRITQKEKSFHDVAIAGREMTEIKEKIMGLVKPIWISIRCPRGLRLPGDGESASTVPISLGKGVTKWQ